MTALPICEKLRKAGRVLATSASWPKSGEAMLEAADTLDALYEAGARVLAGLNERIDIADPDDVPIFDGIADLHTALARARGEHNG